MEVENEFDLQLREEAETLARKTRPPDRAPINAVTQERQEEEIEEIFPRDPMMNAEKHILQMANQNLRLANVMVTHMLISDMRVDTSLSEMKWIVQQLSRNWLHQGQNSCRSGNGSINKKCKASKVPGGNISRAAPLEKELMEFEAQFDIQIREDDFGSGGGKPTTKKKEERVKKKLGNSTVIVDFEAGFRRLVGYEVAGREDTTMEKKMAAMRAYLLIDIRNKLQAEMLYAEESFLAATIMTDTGNEEDEVTLEGSKQTVEVTNQLSVVPPGATSFTISKNK